MTIKVLTHIILFTLATTITIGQSIDDRLSVNKMKNDLKIFKEIRVKANSGLYKYRSKTEIDSIYKWADSQIETSKSFLDFYNIISQLTDFEGSSHNGTKMPSKITENLRTEPDGYFPLPVKKIQDDWRVNYDKAEIPLGSVIKTINGNDIDEIIDNIHKYWTTDGVNMTSKTYGLSATFGRYYRYHYGRQKVFKVEYTEPKSQDIKIKELSSVSFKEFYKRFNKRYSLPFDNYSFRDSKKAYEYEQLSDNTGKLTINTFAIGGNEDAPEHKIYLGFLDSIFTDLKVKAIDNLIVDVRRNSGGTDPNDLVTYAYLADRSFMENKEAWVSFYKIPMFKYYRTGGFFLTKPFYKRYYRKYLSREFPDEKDGRYYQNENSDDLLVRHPEKNAFKGQIYLLISPEVASAGSLFAALLAGNKNAIVVGEETCGGYYGHNGHNSFDYVLPKTKIETTFSIVNLNQDVPTLSNQVYNRGIIPEHHITQTYQDFLEHKDVQLEYVSNLIDK